MGWRTTVWTRIWLVLGAPLPPRLGSGHLFKFYAGACNFCVEQIAFIIPSMVTAIYGLQPLDGLAAINVPTMPLHTIDRVARHYGKGMDNEYWDSSTVYDT